MAHPRKRNKAEGWKRLRRTLKRSQLRKARNEADQVCAVVEGTDSLKEHRSGPCESRRS